METIIVVVGLVLFATLAFNAFRKKSTSSKNTAPVGVDSTTHSGNEGSGEEQIVPQ